MADMEVEDATLEFGGSVGKCINHFTFNPEKARPVKIYSKSKKQWYQNSEDGVLQFSAVPPRHRRSTIVSVRKSVSSKVDMTKFENPSQHAFPEDTNLMLFDDRGSARMFSYSKAVGAWNAEEFDATISEGVAAGQQCFIHFQSPSSKSAFTHVRSYVPLKDLETVSLHRLPLRSWRHTSEMIKFDNPFDRVSAFPIRDYVGRLGPYIFCGEPICNDNITYQAVYVEVSDLAIVYFSKSYPGAVMTKSGFLCNEHDRTFFEAFGRFPVDITDYENVYGFSVTSTERAIDPQSPSFNLTIANVRDIIKQRGSHPANEFWLRVFRALLLLDPDDYCAKTAKEAIDIYTQTLKIVFADSGYGSRKKSTKDIILQRGSDPVNEYFKELWMRMRRKKFVEKFIASSLEEEVPVCELTARAIIEWEVEQKDTNLHMNFSIPAAVRLRAQEAANIWRLEYIQHKYSFNHLVDSLEGIIDYRPLIYSGRCSMKVSDVSEHFDVHKSTIIVTNAILDYHYVLIIIINRNLYTLNFLEVADRDFQEVYESDSFWKELIQWSKSKRFIALNVPKQKLPKHFVRTDNLLNFVENLVDNDFEVRKAQDDFCNQYSE